MADTSPRLIHQGILIKSPPESKSKDLSRWRKRHFRLWSTKTLEYYRTEKSKEHLKKPIDLNKCKSIDGNLKNRKWGNIFCLNTTERKFFLVADSPEAMQEWIGKICELCGFGLEENKSDASKSIDSPMSSPTYIRHANPHQMQETSNMHETPSPSSPSSLLHEVPVYNEDLPPIPNSPKLQPRPELLQSQTSVTLGKSIKQNRQNSLNDSSGTCYDLVPPPRPAEPETPKRRLSSPSESAKLNQIIKDESYVDMQPENNGNEFIAQQLPVMQANNGSAKFGSYDNVPPPIPAGRYQTKPLIGNYDLVPQPRAVLDEYIDCDTTYDSNGASKTLSNQRDSPPPVPNPTYTGFDTLPTLQQKAMQNGHYLSSADDIYDTPPSKLYFDDSIYDTPPQRLEPEVQDSIYDTPPIRENLLGEVPQKHIETRDDSIYDHPPLASSLNQEIYDHPPTIAYLDTENSIYDTPPSQEPDDDSLYDVPPSADIYDVPPSAADLFNFDKRQPPKIDRTLKHASTSDLDIERTAPPPVDRRSRPVLASSVPSFPSSIDRYLNSDPSTWDSIYDSVPSRPSQENRPEAAYLHGDVNDFSTRTMDFGMQKRNNLQYSDVQFMEGRPQHQLQQQEERRSTDYTTVDQKLTKAMQDARISRDFSHAQ